jgi:cytidyltransferase-like protein
MKIAKEIKDLIKLVDHQNISITIGNFDGVHLGHQSFLSEIKSISDEKNAKFVVITFIPHPNQALKGMSGFLINTYEERRALLEKAGVDFLLEVDFTRDFSSLTPLQFVENYIGKSVTEFISDAGLLDKDDFIESVIDSDGWGTLLNSYDGTEEEERVNGVSYYIFFDDTFNGF